MIKIIYIIFLIGFVTLLQAEENLPGGLYVGMGVGSTAYIDNGFAKDNVSGVSEEVTSTEVGAKLFAGYQFNQIFGVETAYVYYGTFKVNDQYTYKAQALSVVGNIGYSFIKIGVRPYVLMGMGYIFSDFTDQDRVDVPKANPTIHLGIGLDYVPGTLGGIGFRIAYESNSFVYDFNQDTPQEEQYAQAFGLLYLGVGYKF